MTIRFDRLAALANMLEDLPKEDFDMETWDTNGCPTCVIGNAMRQGMFATEGFRSATVKEKAGEGFYNAQPWFDGSIHWTAVTRFFGVDRGQAEHLFNHRCRTPAKAREIIKEFIRAHCPHAPASAEVYPELDKNPNL